LKLGNLRSKNRTRGNFGFTLVELLVVISIIAILAAVGAANYVTQLKRGRDGKRLADLNNLRNALEMYYMDNSNQYPSTSGNWRNVSSALGGLESGGYLRGLPSDPKSNWHYLYRSDGTCYCLSAHVEISSSRRTSIGTYCTICPPTHVGECYLVTCP